MSKKYWRVNVVIGYMIPNNIAFFRPKIHALLDALAIIYEIECKIVSDDPSFDEIYLSDHGKSYRHIADLAYFRSKDDTEMTAKEFRQTVKSIFDKSNIYMNYGVDVGIQLQKALPLHPFPDN